MKLIESVVRVYGPSYLLATVRRLSKPADKAMTCSFRQNRIAAALSRFRGSVNFNGQSATSRSAQVADRFFVQPDVPLQLGQNTLRITATDHVGNARVQEIAVTRIAVGSDRLTLLSGNRQTAAANTLLPQPLVVVALNPAGEPLRGLPISFDVLRGTGTISLTADSGPGANEVRASHPALGEAVTFSANTQRGVPQRVNADHGKNQIAQTNAQPLELLSLVVRDALDNPLPNARTATEPVPFHIRFTQPA